MRLAVLDIGSNSAHLRVVDAYPGSAPLPLYRHKAPIRLAETVDKDGALRPEGIARVLRAVGDALKTARSQQVTEIIPIATATIRDAINREEILDAVDSLHQVKLLQAAADPSAADPRYRRLAAVR